MASTDIDDYIRDVFRFLDTFKGHMTEIEGHVIFDNIVEECRPFVNTIVILLRRFRFDFYDGVRNNHPWLTEFETTNSESDFQATLVAWRNQPLVVLIILLEYPIFLQISQWLIEMKERLRLTSVESGPRSYSTIASDPTHTLFNALLAWDQVTQPPESLVYPVWQAQRWYTVSKRIQTFTQRMLGRSHPLPVNNFLMLLTRYLADTDPIEIMNLYEQNMSLQLQLRARTQQLAEVILPGTCMAYRHYIEELAPRSRHPTQTLAWQTYWNQAFATAISTRSGQLWDTIERIGNGNPSQNLIAGIRVAGNSLFGVLSEPIHNFQPNSANWNALPQQHWTTIQIGLLTWIKSTSDSQHGRNRPGRTQQGGTQQGGTQQGRTQQGNIQQGGTQQGRTQIGRVQQGRIQQGRIQQGRIQQGRRT